MLFTYFVVYPFQWVFDKEEKKTMGIRGFPMS